MGQGGDGVPVSVNDLDLPEIDVVGLDRSELLEAFRAARAQHWLVRTPLGFALTAYSDVTALLRDRRWHSALSLLPTLAGLEGGIATERRQRSILAMEGPGHDRLRRLASPAFTPRAVERLRPFIRQVINDLIDPLAGAGHAELVGQVCEPYPIPVICELLGAPKSDWKLFSAWATDVFRVFNNDLSNDQPAIEAALAELDAYVTSMIEQRRRSPAEDLLSRLIAAEEAGDRMNRAELVMMTEAVLLAGTDTTRNQLGCALALFARHPDQWRALGDDPALAAPAVEEVMRHLGAVRATLRVAAEDVEYRDVRFPAGTLVAASLAAANHDPDVWPDPQRFDITRPASGPPQVTFGSGLHYCLGASLARSELQEALVILARRLPDLAVDGKIDWKPATVGIWGPERLPVTFRPGR
jgi:cytochrome P450